MKDTIPGIHHVTAIAGDAQQNLDFYTGTLGLRLVKLTVNFDDPGSYHLYYGDGGGRPGSILTYFAWPGAQRGRSGTGQVGATALSVPPGSLPFWAQRFEQQGVAFEQAASRFGEELLTFQDPDGMSLELIATANDERAAWNGGPLDAAHAIRGVHSVTLCEEGYESTARLLTDTMGFRRVGEESSRFRFECGDGSAGALVDLVCRPDAPRGSIAAGTVHHIAWRVRDDAMQAWWRAEIACLGFNVSPVMERTYFRSIYFREPGGVLFEIATDAPGFAVDEPIESLGARLMLPSWLESRRAQIETILPPLRLPQANSNS